MQSSAATPTQYLQELAEDRRRQIEPVLSLVRDSMPAGYTEAMAFGMIGWGVPLSRYPTTYNGEPLAYVSLAVQKRHNALYLMGLYGDAERERAFRDRWAGGRALDMGRACIRFREPADLDAGLLAETIAAVPVEEYIRVYEASRTR